MEIIGYGGKGGGGGSAPVESPDSLQSKATARVIDLISEGEIEGLVDGPRSIYFDDTPLMADDGTLNFKGVSFETRTGTQQQSYIENFSDVESTQSVGVRVKADTPFIRQINNLNVSKLRVTIGIPTLTFQNLSNGNLGGTSVQLRLSVQAAGGEYVPLYSTIANATYSETQVQQKLIAEAKVNFTWTRINERVSKTYTFKDTGSLTGATVTTTRSETRETFAVIVVKAFRNGATTPAKTKTFKLKGLTDGSTSTHTADFNFGRLFTGKYRFTAEITSGEGSIAITNIPVTELIDTTHTITGKSTSRYQRSFLVPLNGPGPWNIKVERITPDSTQSNLNNQTFVDAISEIVEAKLRYPNSALVALQVDASQFSSIPTRGYDVKLLRVKIPSNYDPITRTYAGNWDGTFQIAWTDNPAWCFYDLVTNERYGLGKFLPEAQVDKWMLYKIGQYCDGLVPDGKGGTEPRMTCNLYLGSREEAFKVINDMASIFRGMVYWSAGSLTAVQDAPVNPSLVYAPANVIDGVFNYSGSSAKARHTVALVSWNDPADGYKQRVEYVEDQFGVAQFGIVSTEVLAIGCTSQGQARRLGQWMLISERAESEVVSFKVGMDGAIARPGDVIKVADPGRAGVRYGGRLVSATSTVLTLDSAVSIPVGVSYTISVLGDDGKVIESTQTSNGISGTVLTLPVALSQTPAQGSMWVLSTESLFAQTFRVIGVTEDERNEFTITALAYEPGKYDAVEYGALIQERNISVISSVPAAPGNLTAAESLYLTGDGVKNKIIVSWSPVPFATSYVVSYQAPGENRSPEIKTDLPSIEVPDVITGVTYTVYVLAVNSLDLRSTESSISYTPIGKTFPPSNVTNFVVSRIGETLRFSWMHITDIDLDHYEIRAGSVWTTGTTVGVTGGNTLDLYSPRGGSFMIRAVDTSGIYSVAEALVIAADFYNINVVVNYDDSTTGFKGVNEGTASVVSESTLQWSDTTMWDDFFTWDQKKLAGGVTLSGPTSWDGYNGTWDSYNKNAWLFLEPATSGRYTTDPIDLGYVTTATLTLDYSFTTIANNNISWREFTQPWRFYTAPEFTWKQTYDGFNASFEIAVSRDGILYSQWMPYVPQSYTFRYMKVRATISTDNQAFLPSMNKLRVIIDVPDRVLRYNDTAVPATGLTLSFSPEFIAVKTVQVTLQGVNAGDRFTVTNKSTTQVTINIYDAAGNPKSGIADIDVYGYGERT